MILTVLVNSDILAQHLADPDWVVFDCRHDLTDPARGRTDYASSHIPGARFLHLDRDLSAPKTGKNGRHPLPDPRMLVKKLGRAGVDSRKQVVAYDAQGGSMAARLWWLLRWLGHLPVAVLDGGWNQWISEGWPQTAVIPKPKRARFSGLTSRILVCAR
jgi:thiosulfate/3-mercaptopyruvate sulfurtransferase